MAGGGSDGKRGGGKGGGGSGKGHKQATPGQIAELRKLLNGLEATNANVTRYRWFTTDRVLHRFITARNGDVEVALKMLLEHLDWRVSYRLDTILDEDLSGAGVSHEFYWSGFDREGRPCLVFRACEHKKSEADGAGPTTEEKVRYYCQLLERGFRDFAPAHKFCLILDCRGAGTNVMDRKLFKVATPIIENNFPETQHATYVMPCNGIITMAWKVISTFIDPGTADKIRLVKDFGDPSLAEAFTPDTLKAFVAVDPSIAPPQPYVAPDPLSNPPPPSKSSASFLSNSVRGHHHNSNNPRDRDSLPNSDVFSSEGTRFSAATLPSAANLPSAASLPAPYNSQKGGGGSAKEGDRSSLLSSYSSFESLVPGVAGGRSSLVRGGTEVQQQQQQQQGLPPQHPRPSAATLAATHVSGGGRRKTLNGGGGGGELGGDGDQSPVLLPPPSPGGSTVFGVNAEPSPSGSQLQPFQPLSPAGAAAAVAQRGAVETEAAAASATALAAGAGAAPPSPSGSNMGHLQPAPPSPAGDSQCTMSSAGRTQRRGGGGSRGSRSRGNSRDGVGGGGGDGNAFDERFVRISSTSGASGFTRGGIDGTIFGVGDGMNVNNTGPSLAPVDHATVPSKEGPVGAGGSGETNGTAGGGARLKPAVIEGGEGDAGGGLGEGMLRTVSRTLGVIERTGVLYKRRDTLRGRFAYRQKQAVLRLPTPEAAAAGDDLSSAAPPPPTLSLLAARGKNETEKVVSLQGAEVTLGTAMAGDLFPFVISFPSSRRQPARSLEESQEDRQAPPRRNTEDFMFTGVCDAGGGAGANSESHRKTKQSVLDDDAAVGELRPERLNGIGESNAGGGEEEAYVGNGLPRLLGDPSVSSMNTPYARRPLSTPSRLNAAVRGTITRESFGPGARTPARQRKTLHLGCDTQEKTLQWARWLADAIALHEAARERAAAAAAAGGKGHETLWGEEKKGGAEADWRGAGVVAAPATTAAAGTAAAVLAPRGSGGRVAGGDEPVRGLVPPLSRRATAARLLEQRDSEFSYRSKYNEVLDALAAASNSPPPLSMVGTSMVVTGGKGKADGLIPPPGASGTAALAWAREGSGRAMVGTGAGGTAPTVKNLRYILDSYRRSKAANGGGIQDSGLFPPESGTSSFLPPRKTIFRSAFSKRRKSSATSSLGKDRSGRGLAESPAASSSASSTSAAAAGAVLKGLGEAGGALMSMRDSEISRLRRAYARSELSREEMKRCLRALAVQLREGEDRTGALLAEREAAQYETEAREAEFAKKEASLREEMARAAEEARQKEELVASLTVENEALQAAIERLRHDFQDERARRLEREKYGGGSAAAAAERKDALPGTPTAAPDDGRGSLGVLGRGRSEAAAAGEGVGGGVGAPLPPHRNNAAAAPASRQRNVRPVTTPTRNGGSVSSGPGGGGGGGPVSHSHHGRPTPDRPHSSAGAAGVEAGTVASAVATGDSNHGGIGSRHGLGSRTGGWAGHGDGCGGPWVLNTDETWVGEVRPPHEVLAALLDGLEDLLKTAVGSPSESTATSLVTPLEGEEGVEATGDAVVGAGGGSGVGSQSKVEGEEGGGRKGGGGEKEVFLAETRAFVTWSRRTGELQGVPPLESVDLPGESSFTEGCLKLLSAHAAAVLHKYPAELTAREEARMAYAIGDGMYTISRLTAHLDALVAGKPTE